MVSRHAQKLACELITSHFGDLVGKVCSCLVHKGTLTVPEIARFTELTHSQLKNCLLVLIQHNCVQAFKIEQEGAGPAAARSFTHYVAFIDIILHRMRVPKFLTLVREHLGEESESLFEGLLEHGRLTFEQIVQRASAQSGKGEADVWGPLTETFAGLVHSCYIERCPVAEPLLPPRSSLEAPKKGARGSSRNRAGKGTAEQETEERRIIAAAAPLEGERFLLPSSLGHASRVEKENMDNVSSSKVGEKRKYECFKEDTGQVIRNDDKEVLWRVNYEEVVRRLRHKACVAQVRSRLDLGAGTILEAMLEATRCLETSVKQKISAPLSMDAIMQAVRATTEGRTMTLERIRASLNQMASDSVGYLSRTEVGGQYAIYSHKILEAARKSEVEAIVLKRFGRESCRVFRLLAMKGQLEQKQISDQALVGRMETMEILYKLLKDDYLQLQEIAKSQDHLPQNTFYLWRVNYSSLMEHIIDDMYHGASNLGQRLAHELEQEQEVLDLLKQMHQSKNTDGSTSHVTLTKSQRDQVNHIRRVATVLETSILKLDDSIMLFHDF